METWKIRHAPRIQAEIRVPGDKSISHRAVMLASLANGPCVIRGFLRSEDCMATVNAMRALGIEIEQPEPDMLLIHGKKRVLTAPTQSRDHTERILSYFLVRPHKEDLSVSVLGDQVPESRDFEVPGDISSAAFWLVAAAAQPKSHLLVRGVGLNPTRTGVLAVLV